MVNAASNQPFLAPGALATIFGTALSSGVTAQAAALPLPGNLAGTSVTPAGRTAPLLFVGPNQINFQVPYETITEVATVGCGRERPR